MTDEAPPALEAVLREATELRKAISDGVPAIQSSPEDLHEFLLRCRGHLDRLEEILGQLTLYKGRVDKAVHRYAGAVEDAEVAAYQSKIKPSDYTSAKERTVEFMLHSLDERRDERKAEQLFIDAKTAHEYVRLLYWGVDGTRKETDTRLRAITLVASLEH